MIPSREQLIGTWISDTSNPLHLGENGSNYIKLLFNEFSSLAVIAFDKHSETILIAGEYSIHSLENYEFIITIINIDRMQMKLYSREFISNSLDYNKGAFITQINLPDFGTMKVTKKTTQTPVRMVL